MMRSVFVLVLTVLSVAWSGAHAQSRTDLERAEASFRAGAAAYAAGDYLAAIQALDSAYALTPLPAIAFSLAQAERRQYFVSHERPHLERAVTLFRQYVEQVQAGGRRADALDALSQLEPLLATLPGGDGAAAVGTGSARTRLMITSEAPGARISLDGGEKLPSPWIREVQPGPHQVVVEADGFHPTTRTVTALAGELILSEVTLTERPSTLVLSTPSDAEIFIDGTFAHQGGARVALELPSGTHRVAVAARGRNVSYHTVTLAPGKAQALEVRLTSTRKRVASRALFIAGGAGLGAGLTLGLFALREQGRAENFLAKQESGNVTAGELARYQDNVTRRERYRLGAGVTLGVAASVFVTGLFLHQLDRPNPQEIQRRSLVDRPLDRAKSPREARARLDVAPQLSRGLVGAELTVQF